LSKKLKIISVAGARPNFMKIAPIARVAEKHPEVEHQIIHTGQHYDDMMSASFFRDLGMKEPDVNLDVGSGSHAEQTARVLERIAPVLEERRPDWLVVVGDVNSTLAATLAASKMGIKTAHVEAGLRSFDRTMPEEINRIVTDALADLLLTHSKDADENLAKEGIDEEKIVRVGNIMIDSLVEKLKEADRLDLGEKFNVKRKEYVYVTIHRPSNVDEKDSLEKIADSLVKLSEEIEVVFPVHPRTKEKLSQYGLQKKLSGKKGMKMIEPVGYVESLALASGARFVLTDSGGIQEETTYLLVPCLTLRPNTERPVTVSEGTNRLTNIELIEQDIRDTMEGRHPKKDAKVPDLWDGNTAERIIQVLLERA